MPQSGRGQSSGHPNTGRRRDLSTQNSRAQPPPYDAVTLLTLVSDAKPLLISFLHGRIRSACVQFELGTERGADAAKLFYALFDVEVAILQSTAEVLMQHRLIAHSDPQGPLLVDGAHTTTGVVQSGVAPAGRAPSSTPPRIAPPPAAAGAPPSPKDSPADAPPSADLPKPKSPRSASPSPDKAPRSASPSPKKKGLKKKKAGSPTRGGSPEQGEGGEDSARLREGGAPTVADRATREESVTKGEAGGAGVSLGGASTASAVEEAPPQKPLSAAEASRAGAGGDVAGAGDGGSTAVVGAPVDTSAALPAAEGGDGACAERDGVTDNAILRAAGEYLEALPPDTGASMKEARVYVQKALGVSLNTEEGRERVKAAVRAWRAGERPVAEPSGEPGAAGGGSAAGAVGGTTDGDVAGTAVAVAPTAEAAAAASETVGAGVPAEGAAEVGGTTQPAAHSASAGGAGVSDDVVDGVPSENAILRTTGEYLEALPPDTGASMKEARVYVQKALGVSLNTEEGRERVKAAVRAWRAGERPLPPTLVGVDVAPAAEVSMPPMAPPPAAPAPPAAAAVGDANAALSASADGVSAPDAAVGSGGETGGEAVKVSRAAAARVPTVAAAVAVLEDVREGDLGGQPAETDGPAAPLGDRAARRKGRGVAGGRGVSAGGRGQAAGGADGGAQVADREDGGVKEKSSKRVERRAAASSPSPSPEGRPLWGGGSAGGGAAAVGGEGDADAHPLFSARRPAHSLSPSPTGVHVQLSSSGSLSQHTLSFASAHPAPVVMSTLLSLPARDALLRSILPPTFTALFTSLAEGNVVSFGKVSRAKGAALSREIAAAASAATSTAAADVLTHVLIDILHAPALHPRLCAHPLEDVRALFAGLEPFRCHGRGATDGGLLDSSARGGVAAGARGRGGGRASRGMADRAGGGGGSAGDDHRRSVTARGGVGRGGPPPTTQRPRGVAARSPRPRLADGGDGTTKGDGGRVGGRLEGGPGGAGAGGALVIASPSAAVAVPRAYADWAQLRSTRLQGVVARLRDLRRVLVSVCGPSGRGLKALLSVQVGRGVSLCEALATSTSRGVSTSRNSAAVRAAASAHRSGGEQGTRGSADRAGGGGGASSALTTVPLTAMPLSARGRRKESAAAARVIALRGGRGGGEENDGEEAFAGGGSGAGGSRYGKPLVLPVGLRAEDVEEGAVRVAVALRRAFSLEDSVVGGGGGADGGGSPRRPGGEGGRCAPQSPQSPTDESSTRIKRGAGAGSPLSVKAMGEEMAVGDGRAAVVATGRHSSPAAEGAEGPRSRSLDIAHPTAANRPAQRPGGRDRGSVGRGVSVVEECCAAVAALAAEEPIVAAVVEVVRRLEGLARLLRSDVVVIKTSRAAVPGGGYAASGAHSHPHASPAAVGAHGRAGSIASATGHPGGGGVMWVVSHTLPPASIAAVHAAAVGCVTAARGSARKIDAVVQPAVAALTVQAAGEVAAGSDAAFRTFSQQFEGGVRTQHTQHSALAAEAGGGDGMGVGAHGGMVGEEEEGLPPLPIWRVVAALREGVRGLYECEGRLLVRRRRPAPPPVEDDVYARLQGRGREAAEAAGVSATAPQSPNPEPLRGTIAETVARKSGWTIPSAAAGERVQSSSTRGVPKEPQWWVTPTKPGQPLTSKHSQAIIDKLQGVPSDRRGRGAGGGDGCGREMDADDDDGSDTEAKRRLGASGGGVGGEVWVPGTLGTSASARRGPVTRPSRPQPKVLKRENNLATFLQRWRERDQRLSEHSRWQAEAREAAAAERAASEMAECTFAPKITKYIKPSHAAGGGKVGTSGASTHTRASTRASSASDTDTGDDAGDRRRRGKRLEVEGATVSVARTVDAREGRSHSGVGGLGEGGVLRRARSSHRVGEDAAAVGGAGGGGAGAPPRWVSQTRRGKAWVAPQTGWPAETPAPRPSYDATVRSRIYRSASSCRDDAATASSVGGEAGGGYGNRSYGGGAGLSRSPQGKGVVLRDAGGPPSGHSGPPSAGPKVPSYAAALAMRRATAAAGGRAHSARGGRHTPRGGGRGGYGGQAAPEDSGVDLRTAREHWAAAPPTGGGYHAGGYAGGLQPSPPYASPPPTPDAATAVTAQSVGMTPPPPEPLFTPAPPAAASRTSVAVHPDVTPTPYRHAAVGVDYHSRAVDIPPPPPPVVEDHAALARSHSRARSSVAASSESAAAAAAAAATAEASTLGASDRTLRTLQMLIQFNAGVLQTGVQEPR